VAAENGVTTYSIKDAGSSQAVYYRIKAMVKTGEPTYSPVIKAERYVPTNAFRAFADARCVVTLACHSGVNEPVGIKVVNMNGQVVGSVNKNLVTGQNNIRLYELVKPADGVYVVVIQGQTSLSSAKLTW
jgi:hypothetical protein